MKIGSYDVGDGHPAYIIAEMSGNHGGSLDRALKIVEAAKEAGANAIKLQTYTADTITFRCSKEDFLIPGESPWAEYSNLWDLYNEAHTPWEWHEEIFAKSKSLGLDYLSSPFDESAVDFLVNLGVSAIKIASPEVTHVPLLKKAASTGLPVILSTGLADQADIDLAVKVLKESGACDVIILQCASAYPAPLAECNLRTMIDMRKRYDAVVGFSDHTIGSTAAIVATASGAKVIEKHLDLGGSEADTVDSFFSADVEEFCTYVSDIRDAEACLGCVDYDISTSSLVGMNGRRSLYVVKKIQVGETLTAENIRCIRPTYGLHPKFYDEVIGKTASTELQPGDRLTLDAIR